MSKPLYRCHYRGLLTTDDSAAIAPLMEQCKAAVQTLIDEEKLMTAALYYYGRQVFLYYEAIGEECTPESFMGALHPILAPWPQKDELRDWAKMYHIYWHNEPIDAEDWKREKSPDRRRGRIALLKQDKMWGYAYHHIAIVQEGLLKGDRYQSIAMHEDMLFSYFEEPSGSVNIRRTEDGKSEAIKGWAAVDPASHFIHLPGSNGENFLLLPAYFALGNC